MILHPHIISGCFMQLVYSCPEFSIWVEYCPFQHRKILVFGKGEAYSATVDIKGTSFLYKGYVFSLNHKNPVAYAYWDEQGIHLDHCVAFNNRAAAAKKRVRWDDQLLTSQDAPDVSMFDQLTNQLANFSLGRKSENVEMLPQLFVF